MYSICTKCPTGDNHNTSMGVSIFFSLILSYFCFLVPAFSPCHGRLRQKQNRVKDTKKEGSKEYRSDATNHFQPSSQKIHKHITKRFQIISSALFCKQHSITLEHNHTNASLQVCKFASLQRSEYVIAQAKRHIFS